MMLGHEIGKELCDALGLPKRTRGFTLRCYTGQPVTVECEYFPDGRFQAALAEYTLVPRPVSVAVPLVEALGYDRWMDLRKELAHLDLMSRAVGVDYGR